MSPGDGHQGIGNSSSVWGPRDLPTKKNQVGSKSEKHFGKRGDWSRGAGHLKLQQNMGSWCGALTNMHWKFGQKVQLWWVAYRSEEMDPTNAIYNYAVLDQGRQHTLKSRGRCKLIRLPLAMCTTLVLHKRELPLPPSSPPPWLRSRCTRHWIKTTTTSRRKTLLSFF